LLDVLRRPDLSDLDVCDLDSPAFRHFVQLGPEDGVDLFPLGEKLVQRYVADDRPESSRRYAYGRAYEVLDLYHALGGFHHLVVDQEVDVRRRVILGDAR